MAIRLRTKAPGDSRVYRDYWSTELGCDVITAVAVVLIEVRNAAGDLLAADQAPTVSEQTALAGGKVAQFRLSGGVDKTEARYLNSVTLQGGDTRSRVLVLAVDADPQAPPLVSLEEAKRHLRLIVADVNDDGGYDDDLVQLYAAAASSRVLTYCNVAAPPDDDLGLKAFKSAALLVLGDLYANREAQALAPTGRIAVPAVENLLAPYRNLRV